ncbi:CotH kinase family protein [Patescibacteria group bacterium]|nr:CotH kinase family protein [Patescibacteria group bacterium]
MLLYSKKSSNLSYIFKKTWKFIQKLSKRNKILLLISVVATIVLLSLALLLTKARVRNELQLLYNQTRASINSRLVRIFSEHPETLVIDIEFEDYQKLAAKREEALSQFVLLTNDDDFVNASVQFRDEKTPVKIRLKGDWTDHLEGNKWSFRIKTKNDNAINGMRKFSIQAPETREYIHEWLFHQIARKEGLIALRYNFIDVIINGEKKGIYAMEEHFSKELLENNKRREGPILKFDESQFWENMLRYNFNEVIERGIGLRTPIVSFEVNKVFSNDDLLAQTQEGQRLLSEFRLGYSSVFQTFDTEQWAKLFALSDLLGSRHGLSIHNIRFYYNPLTGLIEPIPFDVQSGKKINRLATDLNYMQYDLVTKFFEDSEFQRLYIAELVKISESSYLTNFLNEIDQDLKKAVIYINHDEPYVFDPSAYEANLEFIQKKLAEKPNVRAYIDEDSNLSITPLTELASSITKLTDDRGNIIWQTNQDLVIVPGARRDFVRKPTVVSLNSDSLMTAQELTELTLHYEILGIDEDLTVLVEPWLLSTSDKRLTQTTARPSFAYYQINENNYVVPEGNWQLLSDWVLPPGVGLTIEAGAKIDLINTSSIIVNAPVLMKGLEDNYIEITSSDNSGRGMFIYNAEKNSAISYTSFSNISNPQSKSQSISGAVTFYNSPVSIDNSIFKNINSEDALNIVNSSFSIKKTTIDKTFSDGVDIDFSDGSIQNTKISQTGNDGLDISGSNIVTGNLEVSNVGDKGISIGESSNISLENCRVSEARIAIAVKDSSSLNSNNCQITKSEYGITAYQKKPEYGPSQIKISTIINLATKPYFLENKTQAFLGLGTIQATNKKVYETLYPN